MNLNKMTNRVTFVETINDGPEAGMYELNEVFTCSAMLHEPTMRDIQLGNLETNKNTVTIKIRNARPSFVPKVKHQFKVLNGIYEGFYFDIKSVTPDDERGKFLKLIGEES